MERFITFVETKVARVARLFAALALRIKSRHPAPRVGTSDVRRLQVGLYGSIDVSLVACWIDRPHEVGPSWSLFADQYEVLRSDLFAELAHIHPVMALTNGANLVGRLFVSGDAVELRERSVWEIRHNARTHLRTHPLSKYRALKIPQPDLEHAAAWLDRELEDLVAVHGAVSHVA
ncbi:MAG: hypothetical protein AAGF73_11895 [Actinomycetota bacterium]